MSRNVELMCIGTRAGDIFYRSVTGLAVLFQQCVEAFPIVFITETVVPLL